jgi:hypothetical protein
MGSAEGAATLLPAFAGASAKDWDNLIAAGYGSDLLPVALDPNLPIHERSSLRQRGKVPSTVTRDGKSIVGIPSWPTHYSTPTEVAGWRANRGLGMCIITRTVRAIDVDVTDPAEAAAVRALLEMLVDGVQFRRRTGSPKFLAAFVTGGVIQKRIIRTRSGGLIELLATGQQFVAAGIHYSNNQPSGSRYLWDTPDGFAPASFASLPLTELDALWDALVSAFAAEGTESLSRAHSAAPAVTRRAEDAKPDDIVDFLAQRGLVVEYDRSGRVDIICPFERFHTTVSSGSATSYFPAGVGGFERGHFRCLHAHCEHRTDDDFLDAIGYVVEQFGSLDPSAQPSETTAATKDVTITVPGSGLAGSVLARPGYQRTKTGVILAVLNNLTTALGLVSECGAELSFDEFDQRIYVQYEGEYKPSALTDTDYTRLQRTLERRSFGPIPKGLLIDAVRLVARERQFDSAINWAASLKWDGVPRIETALIDYFGAEDSAYTRAVSMYLFTAMAGRCLQPGTKADMAVILEGKQGIGKGTGIQALAPWPAAYAEASLHKIDDNLSRLLRGRLVVEINELGGLLTAEREVIKSWMTRTEDSWVVKYSEFPITVPRRFVLIGTTNETQYLGDSTGERRWLPVRVNAVDVRGIADIRDQLWAEAFVTWASEGVLWRNADNLATAARAQRVSVDLWQPQVRDWMLRMFDEPTGSALMKSGVTASDVAEMALGLGGVRMDRRVARRVTDILQSLGASYGPAVGKPGFAWFITKDQLT